MNNRERSGLDVYRTSCDFPSVAAYCVACHSRTVASNRAYGMSYGMERWSETRSVPGEQQGIRSSLGRLQQWRPLLVRGQPWRGSGQLTRLCQSSATSH